MAEENAMEGKGNDAMLAVEGPAGRRVVGAREAEPPLPTDRCSLRLPAHIHDAAACVERGCSASPCWGGAAAGRRRRRRRRACEAREPAGRCRCVSEGEVWVERFWRHVALLVVFVSL